MFGTFIENIPPLVVGKLGELGNDRQSDDPGVICATPPEPGGSFQPQRHPTTKSGFGLQLVPGQIVTPGGGFPNSPDESRIPASASTPKTIPAPTPADTAPSATPTPIMVPVKTAAS